MQVQISNITFIFVLMFLSFSLFIPVSILFLITLTTFLGFIFLNIFLSNEKNLKPILLFSFASGLVMIVFLTFVCKLLSIKLNIFTIVGFCLFLFILYICLAIKKKRKFYIVFEKKLDKNDLILVIIFYLSVFSRIYPIKDLIAPVAYDPIVMSTISRLIVDNQGIPDSWQPYISAKSSYPPGFPSIIAWYYIISNTEMWTITLFFTNFIQALLPLAVYAFALTIFKNKFQSIVAAIMSLIAVYPIFTFPWGDNATLLAYFLTIMIIPLIYLTVKSMTLKSLFFLFMFSVSSFLVYSLSLFYLILILFPFLFYKKYNILSTKKFLILFVIIILLPFFFTLNYYSQFYTKKYRNSTIVDDWIGQAKGVIPEKNDSINILYSISFEPTVYIFDGKIYQTFVQLDSLSPYDIIFAFVFLCSIFLILKNKIELGISLIGIYIGFALFSNILSYIQLRIFPILDFAPILFYVKSPLMHQFLFFPLSLILSYFFLETKKVILFNKLNLAIFILVLMVVVNLSSIHTGLSFSASRPLVTTDQTKALDWISINTSKNSTILNFITGFDPGGLKGDAGQWIPPITDRNIVFPAVSTPENISIKEIDERVNIMKVIENNSIDTLQFKSLIKKFNISYVFLTDRYIIPNYQFKEISPKQFLNKSDYKLVFQSNQTYIFQVI